MEDGGHFWKNIYPWLNCYYGILNIHKLVDMNLQTVYPIFIFNIYWNVYITHPAVSAKYSNLQIKKERGDAIEGVLWDIKCVKINTVKNS